MLVANPIQKSFIKLDVFPIVCVGATCTYPCSSEHQTGCPFSVYRIMAVTKWNWINMASINAESLIDWVDVTDFGVLDGQLISNSTCCAPMALPLDVDDLVTKLKILGSPKVPWLPLRGVISMQACIFTASSDVKYNFGFLLHLFWWWELGQKQKGLEGTKKENMHVYRKVSE